MGSLFKSKSTVVEDPTAKLAFQTIQPALQTAVSGGINLFNNTTANPAYAGDRTADLNPYQVNSANYLGNFAQGFTPTAANAAGGYAYSNLLPGMAYGSNAADIFGRSSMDPTSTILGQAGQYANNPYVNGLIDSAGRDVTRQLFEQQLPGIDRAATGAGGLNSTRAGVQSAIAQRGAADRLADISSGIRSQFFGKGLDMAQNQWNQNLQNMMNANSGLYQAGQSGLNALGTAQGIAQQGFGQGQMAGGLFQAQNQAQLDAQKSYFDESLANQLAALAGLTGVAQSGTGYKSSAGVATTPSVASQIAALAGAFTGGRK